MRPNGLALGLHLGELLLGEASGKDDGSGDDKGDCHTDDSPDGVHLATLQVVGEDQEVGGTTGEVVGNTHEAGEHGADGRAHTGPGFFGLFRALSGGGRDLAALAVCRASGAVHTLLEAADLGDKVERKSAEAS